MNWDQIAGNWKQVTGHAKEQWGKLTDDDFDVSLVAATNWLAKFRNATALQKIKLSDKSLNGNARPPMRGFPRNSGEINLRLSLTKKLVAPDSPIGSRGFFMAETF